MVQMAFKFIEPRVLLLLELIVLLVAQMLRPLQERLLHFADIGRACAVESIPDPWPLWLAPTRWVISYSPCQFVEGEKLLSSRSCSEFRNFKVAERFHVSQILLLQIQQLANGFREWLLGGDDVTVPALLRQHPRQNDLNLDHICPNVPLRLSLSRCLGGTQLSRQHTDVA